MKPFLVVLTSIMLLGALVSTGMAATNATSSRVYWGTPSSDNQGGPDAYGYTWIDSNEPGGPTVNWIDISTTGTEVEGLGDDNVVGPFPIGFNFHYYWYDVTQYYVGSNGYIYFSTSGQLAQPMPHIPVATNPNDLLCALASDLLFEGTGGSGHCYTWSNNSDSLVVAFYTVPTWAQGIPHGTGSFTFEIILTTADSNITFQYGTQQGVVSNNSCVVGIENATGTIGLEVMYTPNQPPSNYAILFDYPDVVTYQVHDMAAAAAMNENSTGMFVVTNSNVDIWCKIRNAGNQNESSCPVTGTVLNLSNQTVWSDTTTLGAMVAGEVQEITFPNPWTATPAGTYKVSIRVSLTGDMNPVNDRQDCELDAVSLPGELAYDDGVSDYTWGWAGGGGGMGARFAPPTYPAQITSLRFYFTGTPFIPHDVVIVDDDGGNGNPGTNLFEEHISPSTAYDWIIQEISPPIIIESGDFYLGLIETDTTASNSWAMDTTNTDPRSRQTWEYTGVWAPSREQMNYEYMIRCTVDAYEGVCPADLPVRTYTLLENYPNPFNPSTIIRYSLPKPGIVTLKIFDVTGRLVSTLINQEMPEGIHRIGWNGRDMNGKEVATGMYFYTIQTPNSTKSAKMVLIK
jgi:hypothetical protein